VAVTKVLQVYGHQQNQKESRGKKKLNSEKTFITDICDSTATSKWFNSTGQLRSQCGVSFLKTFMA